VLKTQREKQVAVLRSMKNYSEQILKTKDGEIARATLKNKVLENRINCLKAEKMNLKKIVEEKETAIIALHNQLEEEKKKCKDVCGK
jgi:DNA gyrase/topoisomerase IV subunit A